MKPVPRSSFATSREMQRIELAKAVATVATNQSERTIVHNVNTNIPQADVSNPVSTYNQHDHIYSALPTVHCTQNEVKLPLKICLWNTEGIRNVIAHTDFPDEVRSCDIGLFSETLDAKPSAIMKHHYTFVIPASKPPRGRPIGGLLTTVKNSLTPKHIHSCQNCIVIAVDHLQIHSYYFPPQTQVETITEHILNNVDDQYESCVICGDFNCRADNERGAQLIETLSLTGFSLLNDPSMPTYIAPNGSSTIDLIFSRNCGRSSLEIGTCTFRKHKPIHLKLFNWKCPPTRIPPKTRYKTNPDMVMADELFHEFNYTGDATTDLTNLTLTMRKTLTEIRFSHNHAHATNKKWFNESCRVLKLKSKEVNALVYEESKRPDGVSRRTLEAYDTAKKTYKNEVKRCKKHYDRVKEADLINEAEAFGNIFALLKKPHSYADSSVTPKEWQEFFTQLYNPAYESEASFWYAPLPISSPDDPDIMDSPLSLAEVNAAIHALKAGKAAGPDNIKPEHFKLLSEHLTPVFTAICNQIWEGQSVPVQMLQSSVRTLFKKGCRSDPNNYRGIALINLARKLLSSIIHSRTSIWAELNGKLPDYQEGFRKNRSTISALTKLFNAVSASPTPMFALFLDFQKAFDRVNRYKMVNTLICAGLRGKLLQIIINLTQPNKMTVTDGVSQTHVITQSQGLMQGDPLSALLFALYVRDFPTVTNPNEAIMAYADDFCVVCSSKESLQAMTDRIGCWADAKDMKIHLTKSLTMAIHNRRHRTAAPNIFLNNTALPGVKSTTYLGVQLKSNITNMADHVTFRVAKTKAAILAFNKRHKVSDLSWTSAAKIWESAIEPVLTYGFIIIAPHLTAGNWKQINACKNTWDRTRLGLPVRNVPINFLRDIVNENLLCCSILSRNCHQEVAMFHHPHVDTPFQGGQGQDLSRNHDPRVFSPAFYLNVKDYTGIHRRVICSFSVNGFHRSWCQGRGIECFDSRTCVNRGTLCTWCEQESFDLFHLLKCAALFPEADGDRTTVARLISISRFIAPCPSV